MKTIIERNNKKYQAEAHIIGCFNYEVEVWELSKNGPLFMGKVITNDLSYGIMQIINK